MSKYLFLVLFIFSVQANAIDINNIIYYLTSNSVGKNDGITVYILKDDPCVTISTEKYGKNRLCKIYDDMDLEKEYPDIYALTPQIVDNTSISFVVSVMKYALFCRAYINKERPECVVIGG